MIFVIMSDYACVKKGYDKYYISYKNDISDISLTMIYGAESVFQYKNGRIRRLKDHGKNELDISAEELTFMMLAAKII